MNKKALLASDSFPSKKQQNRVHPIGAAGHKGWRRHFTDSAFKPPLFALLHEDGVLAWPVRS